MEEMLIGISIDCKYDNFNCCLTILENRCWNLRPFND